MTWGDDSRARTQQLSRNYRAGFYTSGRRAPAVSELGSEDYSSAVGYSDGLVSPVSASGGGYAYDNWPQIGENYQTATTADGEGEHSWDPNEPEVLQLVQQPMSHAGVGGSQYAQGPSAVPSSTLQRTPAVSGPPREQRHERGRTVYGAPIPFQPATTSTWSSHLVTSQVQKTAALGGTPALAMSYSAMPQAGDPLSGAFEQLTVNSGYHPPQPGLARNRDAIHSPAAQSSQSTQAPALRSTDGVTGIFVPPVNPALRDWLPRAGCQAYLYNWEDAAEGWLTRWTNGEVQNDGPADGNFPSKGWVGLAPPDRSHTAISTEIMGYEGERILEQQRARWIGKQTVHAEWEKYEAQRNRAAARIPESQRANAHPGLFTKNTADDFESGPSSSVSRAGLSETCSSSQREQGHEHGHRHRHTHARHSKDQKKKSHGLLSKVGNFMTGK